MCIRDRFLAERFDMTYIDADGEKKRPYIIHRTSIGCYERTLAWLIEKHEGKFPTWLCPEQVRVLPISEKYEEYAQKVNAALKDNGILSTVDSRSEKIGYKTVSYTHLLPWIMLPNGMPMGETWLTGTYMYYWAFQGKDIDYSCTVAIVIVILGILLSKVVNMIFKEKDY